jgi:hypothetical protein
VCSVVLSESVYATLLQSYNAAYYFVSASTSPNAVPTAAGAAAGSNLPPAPGAAASNGSNSAATNGVIAVTASVLEGLECCEQLVSALQQAFQLIVSAQPAVLASGSARFLLP